MPKGSDFSKFKKISPQKEKLIFVLCLKGSSLVKSEWGVIFGVEK